jgi:hypothetical protein
MRTAVRLLAASAVGLALALAACARDDEVAPVPTVLPETSPAATWTPSSTPAPGDFAGIAQAMHACLESAGLPVVYRAGPDGTDTLIAFDELVPVIWSQGDGTVAWTSAVPDTEIDAIYEEIAAAWSTPAPGGTWASEARLRVRGLDESAAWTACLDQTGYDEQAVWGSADTSLQLDELSRLTVEASNQWAACARANGIPGVIDAHLPVADTQHPAALIPVDTTEQQLRATLAQCPSFDPAIEESNARIWEAYRTSGGNPEDVPDGIRSQPSIGFDYPGYDGTYTSTPAVDPDLEAHLYALQQIVWEAQQEYYAGLTGD